MHMMNEKRFVFLLLLFFILSVIRYVMQVCITEVRFACFWLKLTDLKYADLQEYNWLSINALEAAVAFENQIYCLVGL